MKSRNIYLFIDTETGGLTTEYSLLTAYFGAYTSDFKFVAELDLKLIPDDRIFKVSTEALEINKIDLVSHSKKAVTYSCANPQLTSFFNSLKRTSSVNDIIPIGHNIAFDMKFVYEYLMYKPAFDRLVGYHFIDTASIAYHYKELGIIPDETACNLKSLAKFFKVAHDTGSLHSASYDATLTMHIYKKMQQFMNGKWKSPTGKTGKIKDSNCADPFIHKMDIEMNSMIDYYGQG